jgi:hypothetical protein
MKFKLIILLTALVVVGYSAKSQSDGVSFRLHSGLNAQTFNGTDITGDKLNLSFVPRFNVGVMIDIPIVSELYIKSGLLFTTKGAKSNDQFLGMNMSIEYNVAYAELPLSLLYKVSFGDGHILFGLGPYLSYGIIGNVEHTISTTMVIEKIEFSYDYESLNPIELNKLNPVDYGGNLFLGYEFKRKILLQFNAQVGMAKVNANNTLLSSKTSFKNRGYGLSIEYKF